jgi:peptidoglycan/xylan/chitin deacetylase (PgdA/CDA1 family)
LKKRTRIALFNLLKSAGVFAAWRYLHRNSVVILMLHGTADPKRPSGWTPLRPQFPPEYIDWCLAVIGRHYRFVSFAEAVNILKGEIPPAVNGISVTLDDGYRSNIVDALPVFEKHDAPITIFLPVTNVETRMPMWFDRLDYVLQASDPGGKPFDIGGDEFEFSGNGREGLASSYARFRALIKGKYADDLEFYSKLEEVMTYLERRSGRSLTDIFEDDPWSALLDWEEIGRHRGERVQFGSHTMDHYRVGGLKEDALRHQLHGSKKTIEEKTGAPCRYIAYPNGDCSERARNAALEAGYEAGVTTEEGINRIGCDCMTLRRISLPWASDEAELLAGVSGLSDALFRRRPRKS